MDSRDASRASLQWRVNKALKQQQHPNSNSKTNSNPHSNATHLHALVQELHVLDVTEAFHHRVAQAILFFSPHLRAGLPKSMGGRGGDLAAPTTSTTPPPLPPTQFLQDPQFWECYKGLLVAWRGHCLPFTDHTLSYTRILFNACGGGNATLPLSSLCKSLNPPYLAPTLASLN